MGGLATVATQDTWLDGYGIVAYFLVPLTFIPLAAGVIASPRANRFVESVLHVARGPIDLVRREGPRAPHPRRGL